MIGDPDNIEKMKAVYLAMRNINEIDRSDYFNNYYKEVVGRINQTANHKLEISYDENRSFEDLEHIAESYIESLK